MSTYIKFFAAEVSPAAFGAVPAGLATLQAVRTHDIVGTEMTNVERSRSEIPERTFRGRGFPDREPRPLLFPGFTVFQLQPGKEGRRVQHRPRTQLNTKSTIYNEVGGDPSCLPLPF
jgi:hypothetical protein